VFERSTQAQNFGASLTQQGCDVCFSNRHASVDGETPIEYLGVNAAAQSWRPSSKSKDLASDPLWFARIAGALNARGCNGSPLAWGRSAASTKSEYECKQRSGDEESNAVQHLP